MNFFPGFNLKYSSIKNAEDLCNEGNVFFLHHSSTLSCANANHRAGSQLKIGIKMFWDYLTKIKDRSNSICIGSDFLGIFFWTWPLINAVQSVFRWWQDVLLQLPVAFLNVVFIAQPRLPELVPQQLQQRLWSQPLLNRLFTLWKTSFTGKTYRFQGFQTNFLRFYDIFGDLSDLNRSFWQHIRPKLRFKIRKGPISDLGPTDQTRVAALNKV